MFKQLTFSLCCALALIHAAAPFAQEREDRTLLSHDQMRAIVNEASGERAMHHVLELVPHPRIRPVSEYTGHFRESEVMAGFARDYGYSTVEIESFAAPNRNWAPTEGELWMTAPDPRKLYDIHDVAVSIAANSTNGEVTGDLVDVGAGTRAEDYSGKDVRGKFHSSQDTPDKQDSTQYKRAAVVGVGAMSVLAQGGNEIAARVVSENLARGGERMGDSHRKGLGYMADVATAASLSAAYNEAVVAIRHQTSVERAVVRSANVLFDSPTEAQKTLQAFDPLIERRGAALLDEAKAAYALQAAQRHVAAPEPAMTAEEREASMLAVECVNGSSFSGCAAAPGAGGGRGGGGGGGTGGGRGGQATGLPQHMTAEATILLGKKMTALEIRDFLSGEFDPIPIADVMRYLRAREQAGGRHPARAAALTDGHDHGHAVRRARRRTTARASGSIRSTAHRAGDCARSDDRDTRSGDLDVHVRTIW